MRNVFLVAQIITSIILVVLILLQPKGEGLSQTFGGSQEFYKTRRGIEKSLFFLTIFLIILFTILSIIVFLVR